MAIKVYAKGRSDAYEAFGVFDGKKLTVKKGSRISEKKSDKIQPIVTSLRNDTSVVSSEYILLKDVTFRSPSTAASFVSGTITNGMIRWKNDKGKTLKSLQENRNGRI